MMLYPPINELVSKTGNRYSLVVAAAKRAREIAQTEKSSDKEKQRSNESPTLESRLRERMEQGNAKKGAKPLNKAIEEIDNDRVYFIKSETPQDKSNNVIEVLALGTNASYGDVQKDEE